MSETRATPEEVRRMEKGRHFHSGRVSLGGQQRFERPLPTCAERWDAQSTLQLIRCVAGQVKQPIDFLDSDMLRSVGDLHDLVARADLPFFDDTEIKARSLMRNQQRRHRGLFIRIPTR